MTSISRALPAIGPFASIVIVSGVTCVTRQVAPLESRTTGRWVVRVVMAVAMWVVMAVVMAVAAAVVMLLLLPASPDRHQLSGRAGPALQGYQPGPCWDQVDHMHPQI